MNEEYWFSALYIVLIGIIIVGSISIIASCERETSQQYFEYCNKSRRDNCKIRGL